MTDPHSTEGYSLAEAAGIDVLVSPVGTVQPASAAEAWMWREIVRLRDAQAEADHLITVIELQTEPWTGEMMELRDAAIRRHKARAAGGLS